MAWTESRIFQQLFDDLLNQRTDVDLGSGSIKVALYGGDITPSNIVSATNSAYGIGAWDNTNEKQNLTAWPYGGIELQNQQTSVVNGTLKFEADQVSSGPDATMSNIHGGLVYDSSATSVDSQGICYSYFGGELTVSEGVFTVVWNPGGIFTIGI